MADINTTREQIIENLKMVYDPEISVNIYDLGLIYNIDMDRYPIVSITHTLTSAFCPSADDIIAGIYHAVVSVDGVTNCYISTTFEPPFSLDRMSTEAKVQLGIL